MNPIQHLEWRNLNSNRNYPFMDSATLSFTGGFIPQSWIVDARIYARGNYNVNQPCYISKLIRTEALVALELSSAAGDILGEAKIKFTDSEDVVPIFDGTTLAGCLVIDPTRSALLQAVDEGEYTLASTVAAFLPLVCEYLPTNQVQSINNKARTVVITGNEGVKVERLDGTTVKISIVGDPHFSRYDCVDPANEAVEVLDLNGVFLKNLTLVHYVKTANGSMVGPVKTKLKQKADGSVVLSLKTTSFSPAADTRDLRPAFRITASGTSLTFSMAGGQSV